MEDNAIQVDDIDKQRNDKYYRKKYDISGDPTIQPRVGEKHQAEIPALMSKSDYIYSLKKLHDATSTHAMHDFRVGLPIPVFWIKDDIESDIRVLEEENKYCKGLVPGSSNDAWNEIEVASLTLGLYIFGKNLVQLKRFIGNKTMGGILKFYYGEFYKSESHRRWSQYWKDNKKKDGVYEQKILTKPRQRELLSRLLPNTREECRNKLLEVSKKFVEGKMPLEDFVFTLKASVGINALIELFGIGKENDVKSLTIEPVKSTHAVVPVMKDWTNATAAEIIGILTSDIRLSKSMSNDIFWDAVWPRLLAKGWHSEQPGSDNNTFCHKRPLLFIIPGVEEFSRRLVKGNHYFDSISDILAKVALDPELIELETVAYNNTNETMLDCEDSLQQQCDCYLKTETSDFNADVMEFTIVDTTIMGNEEVTKLRMLSIGVTNKDSAFEEQTKESDLVDDPVMCLNRGKRKTNPSREMLPRPSTASDYSEHHLDMNYTQEKSESTPQATFELLEILASEYSETRNNKKHKGYHLQGKLNSSTSQCTGPEVAGGETSHSGGADFQNEEGASVSPNGGGNDHGDSGN